MSDSQSQQIAAAILGYFAIVAIISLLVLVFTIFCYWRIFSRAGFSGWMSLLSLIPGFGPLIVILILAFGEWPALGELNELRRRLGFGGPGPQYPPSNPQGPSYPSGPQYPGNPGNFYGDPGNPQYPPRS